MTDQALLLMMTDVSDEHKAAYNAWYNDVHIPELMQLPGFISAERFRQIGPGIRYLALYRLAGPEAVENETYKKWRAASESTQFWVSRFTAMERHLYQRIFAASAGG